MIFVVIERSITSYATNNYGKNGSKERQNVKVIFERLLNRLRRDFITTVFCAINV